LKRPVEKVIEDLKNGFITPEMAEKHYGMTVDIKTYEVKKLSLKRG